MPVDSRTKLAKPCDGPGCYVFTLELCKREGDLTAMARFRCNADYLQGYPGLPRELNGGDLTVDDNGISFTRSGLLGGKGAFHLDFEQVTGVEIGSEKTNPGFGGIGVGGIVQAQLVNTLFAKTQNLAVVGCVVNGREYQVGLKLPSLKLQKRFWETVNSYEDRLFRPATTQVAATQAKSLGEQIAELQALRDQGILNDEQLEAAKVKLLQS